MKQTLETTKKLILILICVGLTAFSQTAVAQAKQNRQTRSSAGQAD
jgi:hypothetical protein